MVVVSGKLIVGSTCTNATAPPLFSSSSLISTNNVMYEWSTVSHCRIIVKMRCFAKSVKKAFLCRPLLGLAREENQFFYTTTTLPGHAVESSKSVSVGRLVVPLRRAPPPESASSGPRSPSSIAVSPHHASCYHDRNPPLYHPS